MGKPIPLLVKLFPNIRDVFHPITSAQLKVIDANCERIQFSEHLSEKDFKTLSDFMKEKRINHLRVYGLNSVKNLDFLRHFDSIRELSVDVWDIEWLDGIDTQYANLRSLDLGSTKSKRFSLAFLPSFEDLKQISIDGFEKDVEAIGEVITLEELTLRSVTLDDLDFVGQLTSLWWFALKLGGTRNIMALSDTRPKYLEIWRARGLKNIDVISEMETLQFLFLQTLYRIWALPDLSNLSDLRKITIEDLRNLNNIRALFTASSIKELDVKGFNRVKVEDFISLKSHPSLERASIFTGSEKKNELVKQQLGLPDSLWGKTNFPFS